ncbi:MarC family protein [Rubripirellula amarantea]|nr:MarC family protein [Rubripirellula amarantea]
MSESWQTAVTVFMAFFAVMNPIANTAVFVSLVGDLSSAERTKTAVKALLVAFVVVASFAAIGKVIFELFGITLPALKITGGVLVFLIGYRMLQGKHSEMHRPAGNGVSTPPKDNESTDVAVSPLALPILAGPGTLATAMNFAAGGGVEKISVTIGAFAILCLITLGTFLLGQRLTNLLGHSGLQIVTQLMGLIMAVIGTQMLIEGVATARQMMQH